jgi:hypothetical protein
MGQGTNRSCSAFNGDDVCLNRMDSSTHKPFLFFPFAAAFAKFCFTLSFTILAIKL